MSGGVDSSVAAALLAEQGHDVIGLSMQLYDVSGTDGDRSFGSCCSIDDLHDARRVAAAINIPHYIVNFEKQFDEQVVSNFVREYAAGRTPLPCAHCNSDLKFATLLERANGFGADAVATGHYARVEKSGARHVPAQARRRRVEGPVLLPLLADAGSARPRDLPRRRSAEGRRPRVRAPARQLPVADKPDSQEICFIPDHDYASFLTAHSPRGSPAPATSSTSRARCWRSTAASIASRSASARAWASRRRRPARRCTCSRSGRTIGRSSSARRPRSSGRR